MLVIIGKSTKGKLVKETKLESKIISAFCEQKSRKISFPFTAGQAKKGNKERKKERKRKRKEQEQESMMA